MSTHSEDEEILGNSGRKHSVDHPTGNQPQKNQWSPSLPLRLCQKASLGVLEAPLWAKFLGHMGGHWNARGNRPWSLEGCMCSNLHTIPAWRKESQSMDCWPPRSYEVVMFKLKWKASSRKWVSTPKSSSVSVFLSSHSPRTFISRQRHISFSVSSHFPSNPPLTAPRIGPLGFLPMVPSRIKFTHRALSCERFTHWAFCPLRSHGLLWCIYWPCWAGAYLCASMFDLRDSA